MNRSRKVSIGFIYMSNCSFPTEGVSIVSYSDWQIAIAFVVASILTIVVISVAALCKKRYVRSLHRTNTIRSDLNRLASFELQC